MEIAWFFFAIAATIIWSVSAVILKFVRVNYIKSTIGYLIITAPVTLFSLALLFFGKFNLPSLKMILLILVSAGLGIMTFWFYLESIHKEEVSRVTTFFGLSPLIVLILSTIFLKEVLTLKDYLAFPLIITGSMLISIKKVDERFALSTGMIMALFSIIFLGIQNIILKIISEVDFVSMMLVREALFLGIFSSLFIFSRSIRKKTKEDLKQLNVKKMVLIYASECAGIIGMVFSYIAIQKGPVSLVSLIEGTESLFVIVFVVLISVFLPKILKEEITKKTITLKIISALLMIGGLYLITI